MATTAQDIATAVGGLTAVYYVMLGTMQCDSQAVIKEMMLHTAP